MNELTINVETHINLIRKICWEFWKTYPFLDVQDTIQECCLHLLEQLDKYNPIKAKPTTFVQTICTNHIKNLIKKSSRKKRTMLSFILDEISVWENNYHEENENTCYTLPFIISNDPRNSIDFQFNLDSSPLAKEILFTFQKEKCKYFNKQKLLKKIEKNLIEKNGENPVKNAIWELKNWFRLL